MTSYSRRIVTVVLLLSVGMTSSCTKQTHEVKREPNTQIRAKVQGIERQLPTSVCFQFCLADKYPGPPKWSEYSGGSDVQEVLEAIRNSDRDSDKVESVGEGQDNMALIEFRHGSTEVGRFCVDASELDSRWGKAVRKVFEKYMPKEWTLRPEGEIAPRAAG